MSHRANCPIRAECLAAVASSDVENRFNRGSDLDSKIKVFYQISNLLLT